MQHVSSSGLKLNAVPQQAKAKAPQAAPKTPSLSDAYSQAAQKAMNTKPHKTH